MEPNALPAAVLRDTIKDPNYVTLDASRQRLELAADAGALEMSLDLAQTIDAGNSLEKMLTHQLAASHRSIMKLNALLNRNLESLQLSTTEQLAKTYVQTVNVETCRLAGALTRLQGAFQEGVLALQKLQTRGQQTMVVQHVHVSDGGQAVVAGQVKGSRTGARTHRGATKNDR